MGAYDTAPDETFSGAGPPHPVTRVREAIEELRRLGPLPPDPVRIAPEDMEELMRLSWRAARTFDHHPLASPTWRGVRVVADPRVPRGEAWMDPWGRR